MSSSLRRGSNQPKGRRRNVAGNGKVAGLRYLVAEYSDTASFFSCSPHQEIIEHFFHVVACWQCLFDGGLASGKKTRQQQRTFDLCACHRRAIMTPTQRTAADA